MLRVCGTFPSGIEHNRRAGLRRQSVIFDAPAAGFMVWLKGDWR